MDLTAQIFHAQVMHRRVFPKENAFKYRVYYFAFPLPAASLGMRAVKFHAKDLGYQDGSDPLDFARDVLEKDARLNRIVEHIMLVTMPRVLGYVFNPVSFYLCLDQEKRLRAVICEVHNTFHEQHVYLCKHQDLSVIDENDALFAQKLFHVSPFLDRAGSYKFRFSLKKGKLGVWINHIHENGRCQLYTSLTGRLEPLTQKALWAAFWRYPLVTMRAMFLIHWQALKLFMKSIGYRPKPAQSAQRITQTGYEPPPQASSSRSQP